MTYLEKPKDPFILFHAGCWDGFCAAWIASRALGTDNIQPVYYGTPPPDVTGKDVFILDFSYPRNVLLEMRETARSMVVLDHHKSAKAALEGLDFCRFSDDHSGARMTWDFFFDENSKHRRLWVIDYVEDRDLWKHELSCSQEINAALRSHPLDLRLWDSMFLGPDKYEPPPQSWIDEGRAIRRREKQIIDQHVKNARRVLLYTCGPKILTVNATVLFSEIAGELAKGEPFGACWFQRQDGKVQWSLRSDDNGMDVSEIAAIYGGGGHTHSAGFETNEETAFRILK